MPTNVKDVRSYLVGYFKGKLTKDDLTTKRIRDLDIDSLDLVEFLMALEEKFETEIDADAIDPDMTLEQFCELIEKRR